MRIADMKVGEAINADMLILSSSIRLTKNRTQYLDLVLSDGTDKITAKHWGWVSDSKPDINSVMNITAEVSEWAGSKQLTIKDMQPGTKKATEFIPKGDFDLEEYAAKFDMLIMGMENKVLADLVVKIYNDFAEDFSTVPAASRVHHAYIAGTYQHCIDTAILAKAIATNIEGCNVDLCVAGALLHDLGKLKVYEMDGSVINYTDTGHLLEHIVKGAIMLEQYREHKTDSIIDLLQHIIVSHHDKLEYGAPVTPKFLEAVVVHHADNLDAKANIINRINKNTSSKYTEKEWALNNSAMLSQKYIESVMLDA